MKSVFLILMFSLSYSMAAVSQTKLPPIDKSPMDASYCPPNFPVLKIQDKATDPLIARVLYSRPEKQGRNIFGELIEYGKVWRLGANEATEIEFFRDVKFGNSRIKKGRYTIYAIPTASKWTIIVNRDTDIWGSFRYDIKKDVSRFDVPVETLAEPVELFTLIFEKGAKGHELQCYWDNIKISIPISL